MYHPRLKGTHYEMGCTMGRIFQKSGAQFPISLDPAQDGAETIEGRGCTAFSFVHNGRTYYGRNNDLPPFMRALSKSIFYQPDGAPAFILNTSSFINGEEGINHHGLAVAMTFVVPRPEEIRPGLNSVFLVRYLLEYCATTAEALSSLHNLPIASPRNILIADPTGEMIVAECCPSEVHLRAPETDDNGQPFIVTVNAFTSDHMRPRDGAPSDMFFTQARYHTAYTALKNPSSRPPLEKTTAILDGSCGFMCRYPSSMNFDTIWSSIFDLSNLQVLRAEGNPSRARYKKDTRLANTS